MSLKEATPRKKYYKGAINICCLCGQDKFSDKFTDIFSAVGRRKRIAEAIENVLGIRYEDIEGRPTKVCRSCQSKLDGFDKFKRMALEINKNITGQVTSKRCLVFSPNKSGPNKKAICTSNAEMPSPLLEQTEDTSIGTIPTNNDCSIEVWKQILLTP